MGPGRVKVHSSSGSPFPQAASKLQPGDPAIHRAIAAHSLELGEQQRRERVAYGSLFERAGRRLYEEAGGEPDAQAAHGGASSSTPMQPISSSCDTHVSGDLDVSALASPFLNRLSPPASTPPLSVDELRRAREMGVDPGDPQVAAILRHMMERERELGEAWAQGEAPARTQGWRLLFEPGRLFSVPSLIVLILGLHFVWRAYQLLLVEGARERAAMDDGEF